MKTRWILAGIAALWILAALIICCSPSKREISREAIDRTYTEPGEILWSIRYNDGSVGYAWEPIGGKK